ncbi:hypothetical protein cypCar_00033327, partial [Cyprinus carpio]
INDLFQVPMPVMLLPDDFKANIKMKVNNHLFNKYVSLTRSPPGKDGKCQEAGLVLISYDRTLIVKQISSEEVEDMHNILSEYHQHIVTCHGSTLLPQFLGLYRVTVDNEDTYLLVMRNMFSHRLTVHRKYDLKGSLVSREASDKEKAYSSGLYVYRTGFPKDSVRNRAFSSSSARRNLEATVEPLNSWSAARSGRPVGSSPSKGSL